MLALDFDEHNNTYIAQIHWEACFLSEFWTKNQAPKEYAGAAGAGAFAAEMKKRGFTDRELEMNIQPNHGS